MDGEKATASTTTGTSTAVARQGPGFTPATALAVLVAAGTALGAVLLRPEGRLLAKGTGPLSRGNATVLLLAAVWLFAGILLANRYRMAVGYDQKLSAFEQRLSDLVGIVLMVMAFATPVLAVALHRFTKGRGEAPATGGGGLHQLLPVPSQRPEAKPQHDHGSDGFHFPLLRVLVVVTVVLLVLAAAAAAAALYRSTRRTSSGSLASYEIAGEHDVLADAVDSGRRALLDGDDARTAVIACYAAMEASLAASGVARHASDSPQDLLERTAASGLLTGGHATALTALFREARYSTHPMDAGHRDRAGAALAGIAAQLAAAGARSADAVTPDAAPGTGAPGTAARDAARRAQAGR